MSPRLLAILSVSHVIESDGPHPVGNPPIPIATLSASRYMTARFDTRSRSISHFDLSVSEYVENSVTFAKTGAQNEKRSTKRERSAIFLCLPVYVCVFARNIEFFIYPLIVSYDFFLVTKYILHEHFYIVLYINNPLISQCRK